MKIFQSTRSTGLATNYEKLFRQILYWRQIFEILQPFATFFPIFLYVLALGRCEPKQSRVRPKVEFTFRDTPRWTHLAGQVQAGVKGALLKKEPDYRAASD